MQMRMSFQLLKIEQLMNFQLLKQKTQLVIVQLVQRLVHVLLFQLFLVQLVDALVLLNELVHGYVLALLQLLLSYGSSQLFYLLQLLVQQLMKFSIHLNQLV